MTGYEAEIGAMSKPEAAPPEQAVTAPSSARAETKAPPDSAAAQTKSELDSLLLRMEILEPGDYKLVASILETHPAQREAILAKAQEVCGNATVTKALELLANPKAAPAASKSASEPAAAPTGADAVDAAVGAKHGSKQSPETFDYLTSPLALEYDRTEKIRDHVDFIRKNPQLRDKVLSGAAEFDPDLAKDVERALRGEAAPAEPQAPSTAPTVAPSTSGPAPEPAPAPAPAPAFDYVVSPLALEYDREEKIQDHVDFILKNPQLRDQVLIGAAEFDPALAEEVRRRLANPKPAPAVTETEPTPSSVVAEAAQQAAPEPVKPHAHTPTHEPPHKQDKPESGWVTRARAYNAANQANVNIFLQLTGSVCLDTEGNLDPNLVAKWQADHGTAVDGRVGDKTVTTAALDHDYGDKPKVDPALIAELE
jgi:hypothetical protein